MREKEKGEGEEWIGDCDATHNTHLMSHESTEQGSPFRLSVVGADFEFRSAIPMQRTRESPSLLSSRLLE